MRRGTIRSLIQHWFEWIQLRRTTIGTSYNRLSTAQTKWPTDEWVRAINYPVGLHLQRNSRDTEVRTPSCPKAICTCEYLVTNCAPFQRSGPIDGQQTIQSLLFQAAGQKDIDSVRYERLANAHLFTAESHSQRDGHGHFQDGQFV